MQEGIEERGGVFYIVCVQQRRGKRRGKQLFVVASTRYVCAVCNDVLYTARAVCRSWRNGDGGEFPYLLCPPPSLYLPFHAAWSVGLMLGRIGKSLAVQNRPAKKWVRKNRNSFGNSINSNAHMKRINISPLPSPASCWKRLASQSPVPPRPAESPAIWRACCTGRQLAWSA